MSESVTQVCSLPADDEAMRLRSIAIRALSRREHSRAELTTKLCKGDTPESTVLFAVLDRLEREDLQSDSRFAEAVIQARVRRGKGLRHIQHELAQKGVSEIIIETALIEADIDWFELARQTAEKKFGCEPPADWAERAKRSRFLQYRGFGSDEIRSALG